MRIVYRRGRRLYVTCRVCVADACLLVSVRREALHAVISSRKSGVIKASTAHGPLASDTGIVNPLAGNPVGKVMASNGDAAGVTTLKMGVLYNSLV